MKRKCFVLSIILCIQFLFCSVETFAYNSENASLEVNQETIASNYVNNSFNTIIGYLMNDNIFMSRVADVNALYIGEPYLVYHAELNAQNNVFYFPIIDESIHQVVYLIEAIGYDGQYACNTLDSMVDLLNDINYIDNECIAYYINGDVYFETEFNVINSTDYYNDDFGIAKPYMLNSEDMAFKNESFYEKQTKVNTRINNLFDLDTNANLDEESLLNKKMGGLLTLPHAMGQYGYNICWASSVATVHNYFYTSVVNGFEVCTRMGIDYNAGGNVYEIQDALWLYGVNYNYLRLSALTWDQLKQNIDSASPIIASGANSAYAMGHTVTVSGYLEVQGTNRMQIWNSDLNAGAGGFENIAYGEPFYTDRGGIPYYWASTVSAL